MSGTAISKTVPLKVLMRDPPYVAQIPDRMQWTSSSLKLFRACKRKFFWKYMMRLRSKFKDRHLMIGSAFHNCLGEWYRGQRSSMPAIAGRYANDLRAYAKEATMWYDQTDMDKLHTTVDTFQGMMQGYGTLYEQDRKNWVIERASIEQHFKVEYQDFDYMGKVDLVKHTKGEKRKSLVEHKTASSIDGGYIERLPLDTQIRGYCVGSIKGLGYPINAVTYDIVKKCKLRRKSNENMGEFAQRVAEDYLSRPDFYFHREELLFAKEDLAAFEYELHQTHQEYKRIIAPLKDVAPDSQTFWDELFGSWGSDNPRAWTPNDSSCRDFFRLCEYHNLCTIGLDRGTAMTFHQGDSLHEELTTDEAGD